VGEKLALDFASGVEIILQAELSLAGFLVETRVLEGHGDVRSQLGEHPLIFRSEGVRLDALEIENANKAILEEKRNHEFGASVEAGIAPDVACVGKDVVHTHGAALGSGGSGEAAAERQAQEGGDSVLIAHAKDTFEKLRRLIPEHDSEHVVIDEALDTLGDTAQEFFAVEDGGQLPTDVVEKAESLGLFGISGKQTLRDRVNVAQKSVRSQFGNVFHHERPTKTLLLDVTQTNRFQKPDEAMGLMSGCNGAAWILLTEPRAKTRLFSEGESESV